MSEHEILPLRGSVNVVAKAARDLQNARFNPIVLPPRSKNPNREGWQNERYTAADVPAIFLPTSNIGVLLGKAGNGRVDIDGDCLEAIKLMPEFLPRTDFIHGRPSRPRSHYWYTCNPVPEHRKFEFNGECLLELRSVGQTVAPPSIHPSGEQLTWDHAEGTPASVASEALTSAVRELAAATLTVRGYPQEGSRHFFSLAVAGFLLRQGWDEAHVRRFVRAVATVAGDEEIRDRETAVESTAERLVTDGKAVGGTRLRELMGNAAFDKFCEWLGFARAGRFEVLLPTIEADEVAPEILPQWPEDTLEGDRISDLTYALYDGTAIPPQFLRETINLAAGALIESRVGFPQHRGLHTRRYLALVSERAQQCKKGNPGIVSAGIPLRAERYVPCLMPRA